MRIISYILFILLLFPAIASTQQVSNIHFKQVGKQIHIYYDLEGDQQYTVQVFCSTDNGITWGEALQMVSGAVGKGQKPGNGKEIVWDVLSEREELNEQILFKIKAIPIYKSYKNSFLPVFIPGARLKYYPGGKTRGTVRAVAFYGLIGSSVLFKLGSNKQYELYHQATTQEDMDKYYDKANTYYQIYQVALVAGITVWVIDMIVYGAKGFKPVNNRVAMGYDPVTNSMNLTYTYNF